MAESATKRPQCYFFLSLIMKNFKVQTDLNFTMNSHIATKGLSHEL